MKRRHPTGSSPAANDVFDISKSTITNGKGKGDIDISKVDRRFYRRTKKDAFMLSFVIATLFHICYKSITRTSSGGKGRIQKRKNMAAEAAALSRAKLRAALAAIEKQSRAHADGDGIFIAVKTTQANHQDRVSSVLNSWGEFVTRDIAFFTDDAPEQSTATNDMPLRKMTDPMLENPTKRQFNLINTECPLGHSKEPLCCKTSAEIQYFYNILQKEPTKYQWLCAVDDDTFLLYPNLKQYLREIEARDGDNLKEYFIGHSPAKFPVNKGGPKAKQNKKDGDDLIVHQVEYATGGAGWCLSANLVKRGIDNFRRLVDTCNDVWYSDDVTLGYVVQVELGVQMVKERMLHSHLDTQVYESRKEAMDQITFGSGKRSISVTMDTKTKKLRRTKGLGFVEFPGFKLTPSKDGKYVSDVKDDPMGFRSLYCNFFPQRCPQHVSVRGGKKLAVQIKKENIFD